MSTARLRTFVLALGLLGVVAISVSLATSTEAGTEKSAREYELEIRELRLRIAELELEAKRLRFENAELRKAPRSDPEFPRVVGADGPDAFVLTHRAFQDKHKDAALLALVPRYKKLLSDNRTGETLYLHLRIVGETGQLRGDAQTAALDKALAEFPKHPWVNYMYGFVLGRDCAVEPDRVIQALSSATAPGFPVAEYAEHTTRRARADKVALGKARKFKWALLSDRYVGDGYDVKFKATRSTIRYTELLRRRPFAEARYDVAINPALVPITHNGHPIGCGVRVDVTNKGRDLEDHLNAPSVGLGGASIPEWAYLDFTSTSRNTISAFFSTLGVAEANSFLFKP